MLRKTICIIFSMIIFSQINATGWTGAAGNGLWQDAGNWDSGVPIASTAAFINLTGANVLITGIAECSRIYVGSLSATITIDTDQSLIINVDGANYDGLFLREGSSFINYGDLIVKKVIGTHTSEGIHNQGDMTNHGSILVEDISFTGAGVTLFESILNDATGTFDNHGTITMKQIDGYGLHNEGTFINHALGLIDITDSVTDAGIYNGYLSTTPFTYFTNDGVIQSNGLSTAIHNFSKGIFVNNNKIFCFSGPTFASLRNFNDFTNSSSGLITINHGKQLQNGQTSAGGTGTFTNDGTINMINVTGSALSNKSNYHFNNNGTINLTDCFVSLSNSGDLTNHGDINIQDAGRIGVGNNGEVYNHGNIIMNNVDDTLYAAVRNSNFFYNFAGGVIGITDSEGQGIFNSRVSNDGPAASFTNYGSIDIDDVMDARGIYSGQDSDFNNQGFLQITNCPQGFVNYATLVASGELDVPLLKNSGDLSVGPGQKSLNITGDLDIGGLGTIEMGANGHLFPGGATSGYDQITVEGNIEFGHNEIQLTFASGYSPPSIANFDLITYQGSSAGFIEEFTTVPVLSQFQPSYEITNTLRIDYDPCLGAEITNTLLYSDFTWETPSAWSQGHIPLPCENVQILGTVSTFKNISINSSNAKAKTLNATNCNLTINAGASLYINPNYKFESPNVGAEGLELHNSHFINHGTLTVKHIADSEAIEIFSDGVFDNYGDIILDRLTGSYPYGVFIRGALNNYVGATISTEIIEPDFNQIPVGLYNRGTLFNAGNISSLSSIQNSQSTSVYMGATTGSINAVDFYNEGKITSGVDRAQIQLNCGLIMQPNSAIEIKLSGADGPGAANGHDQLVVNGNIDLDEELAFTLEGGYEPTEIDQFLFLDYAGTKTGDFATITLPAEINDWAINNVLGEMTLLPHIDCKNSIAIWEGNAGNVYENPANWNIGAVPRGCHTVMIEDASSTVKMNNYTAEVHHLTVDNSYLYISPFSELTVDGQGQSGNIIKINSGTLANEGILNITNNSGTKSNGININSTGVLNSSGDITISNLTGNKSYGIQSFGTVNIVGDLIITDIPNGGAINNIASSVFQIQSAANLNILNCPIGINNLSTANFELFGTLYFGSALSNYAIRNSATFTVFPTGLIDNIANGAIGIINSPNSVFTVQGVVE